MSKRKPIDVNELRKVFRLKDGKLERYHCWKKSKRSTWKTVESKGTNNGYCRAGFNGKTMLYHVIVLILTTGEDIPEGMDIDHINGNRVDNRIENLRLVTSRGNSQNMKVHRKGKLVGCSFNKLRGKYMAHIQIREKLIHLGCYITEEEAHNAYVSACKYIEEYVDAGSFRELVKEMASKTANM